MANLSNINNILRVSSSGVGLNKNNTGPSELDIESAGADMIDITRTGLKTYRFAISGTSTFSIFDVAANDDRFAIDTSGNVGIGTTSPTADLSVGSTSTSSGDVHLRTTKTTFSMTPSNTDAGGILLDVGWVSGGQGPLKFGIGGSEKMRIDSSGNIGFGGQTSPSYPLDGSRLRLKLDANTNHLVIQNTQTATSGSFEKKIAFFGYGNAEEAAIVALGNQYFGSPGSSLTFKVQASEKMRITNAGNVGIGKTSPSQKLDVEGSIRLNSELQIFTGTTDIGQISNSGGALNIQGTSTRDVSLGSDSFPQAVFIEGSNGRVGIGTTSPSAKLHVHATSGDGLIRVTGDNITNSGGAIKGFNNGLAFNVAPSGGGTEIEAIRINGSGNVGIGVTSPDNKLDIDSSYTNSVHIQGTGSYNLYSYHDSGGVGWATGSGVNWNNLLYLDAANNAMRMYANGSERMRIHSNGRVSIGTTTASANTLTLSGTATEMDMTNTSTNGRQYRFESDSAGNFIIKDRTANADRIVLNSSGKVTISNSGATNIGILQLSSSVTSYFLRGGSNYGYLSYHTGGYHRWFGSDGAEDMRINSAGNLGIGTTSPDTKLEVNTDTNNDGITLNGTSDNLRFNIKNDQATSGKRAFSMMISGSYPALIFQGLNDSYGFTRNIMALDHDGNVGIGTLSPGDALEIYGATKGIIINNTSETDAGIMLRDSADPGQQASIKYGSGDNALKFYNSTTERMRIDSSGNVGIGTTSPTYKFHVASSNNVSIFEDTSGSSGAAFCLFNAPSVFAMGSITRNGTANSVLFNTGSDYRLKEDLQDFNALDLVDNITAYDYKWKDTEQRDYGFVAHELQEVMPNVVTGEKDGEKMQSVDYSKLTPVLLKAIQELKQEIQTLKTQINN